MAGRFSAFGFLGATLLFCLVIPISVNGILGRSIAVAEEAISQADRLFQQGTQQYYHGSFPEALSTLQQALTGYRESGNRMGEADVLNRLGEVYLGLSQYDQAQAVLEEALTLNQAIENRDRATFRDVELWNLTNTDLVVLSACETGLGEQLGNGREILGFGYLMQQAGAKAAIASLWSVDDGGTQALMNAFYGGLEENMTKIEALRQAQIALITGDYNAVGGERGGIEIVFLNRLPETVTNSLSHPYYWESFILIGNGL